MRTHRAVIIHRRVSGKWQGIYFAQTICSLSVFKSKLHQKGILLEGIHLQLGLTAQFFCWVLIISGQRHGPYDPGVFCISFPLHTLISW